MGDNFVQMISFLFGIGIVLTSLGKSKGELANSAWPEAGGGVGQSGDLTLIPSRPSCSPNCRLWKFGSSTNGDPYIGEDDATVMVQSKDGIKVINSASGEHIRTLNFESTSDLILLKDGGVMIGTGETYVARLSATGDVKWKTQVDDTKDPERKGIIAIQWDPTTGDFLALTEGSKLVRLDSGTGAIIWSVNTEKWTQKVFTGMRSLVVAPVGNDSIVFIAAEDLHALSTTHGSPLWTSHSENGFFFSVAVTSEGIFASTIQHVVRLDFQGKVVWKSQGGGEISATEDIIYLGGTGGNSNGVIGKM